MGRILAILGCMILCGCAGNIKEDALGVMSSPSLFAVCKAIDVGTTMVALNTGKFVEANPLLKLVIGPHNFFPLVGFSVGMYLLLKWYNEPKATMAANAVTCGVGLHNAVLLHSGGVW